MKALDDVRDVCKGLKHSRPATKYCPKCGSPKLKLSSSLDYWLLPQTYVCSDCGYAGQVFMELEKEEEK